MSTFKSFDPPKFSKHSNYKPGGRYYLEGNHLSERTEYCANCEYTRGGHSGINDDVCPTEQQIANNPYLVKLKSFKL